MNRLQPKGVAALLHLPAIADASRRFLHLAGLSVKRRQVLANPGEHFVVKRVIAKPLVAFGKMLGLIAFPVAQAEDAIDFGNKVRREAVAAAWMDHWLFNDIDLPDARVDVFKP